MQGKITIEEMSEYCADNSELTVKQCKHVIKLFLDGIEKTIQDGHRVHLTGFGMFETQMRHYPAEGINKKDVDKIQVLFHASDLLEGRINHPMQPSEEQPIFEDSDQGQPE